MSSLWQKNLALGSLNAVPIACKVLDDIDLFEDRTNESLGVLDALKSFDARSVLDILDRVLDIILPVRRFHTVFTPQSAFYDPGYRRFVFSLDMSACRSLCKPNI